MKYNPFRPGQIITPGLFAGRDNELRKLEKAFLQAKNGNPAHFALVGERGIGKSSLLLFSEYVASGELEGLYDNKFSFIVVSLTLSETHSETDILCYLGAELQRKLKHVFKLSNIAKSTWDFLSRWEVLGVAYHVGTTVEARPFELIEELAVTISKAAKQVSSSQGKDGILFLIDEADKPKWTSNLGRNLKLLTENLTKKGTHNVLFGLAGLNELFDVLRKSHESSPRIFDPIELKPLLTADQKVASRKVWMKRTQKTQNLRLWLQKLPNLFVNIQRDFRTFFSSSHIPHLKLIQMMKSASRMLHEALKLLEERLMLWVFGISAMCSGAVSDRMSIAKCFELWLLMAKSGLQNLRYESAQKFGRTF